MVIARLATIAIDKQRRLLAFDISFCSYAMLIISVAVSMSRSLS